MGEAMGYEVVKRFAHIVERRLGGNTLAVA